MAMNVNLRSKNGEDILTQELFGLTVYPDIINRDGKQYIIKRLMPDKQSAYYYEANVYDLVAGGAQRGGSH